MFSSKQLSENQVEEIRQWAAEGAQLAEIQRRLNEDMGFHATYMDTRFVVLDLGIELASEEKEDVAEPVEVLQKAAATGETRVTMDSVAQPGALISGRVEFSDGEGGIWKLDQTGQPSLNLDNPGYEPSEKDIMEFQNQLRDLIKNSGMM